VTHLVRNDAPFDPGVTGGPPEHGPDVLLGHLAAAKRGQQDPAPDARLAALVDQRWTVAMVPGSRPTVRGLNARASAMRRPARYRIVIRARLRMPGS